MDRLLPIGIQNFEKIRKGHYYYVDKTKYIIHLVSSGSYYFLSRPRRFGKSLFVSTLEAWFRGRKELFEGLEIAESGMESKVHPVIKLSFAGNEYSLPGKLESHLDYLLSIIEEEYGVVRRNDDPAERLAWIIVSLYRKTGEKVVILVDEYDKPVLDALFSDMEVHNRALLRGLYGPLKECDEYIEFCFITGITKIDHVNIFSGLNQLEDISRNDEYSAVCGITEEELFDVFSSKLYQLAEKNGETIDECRSHLKSMYDGYRFSRNGEGVFNPFSLLLAMKETDYGQYWFMAATPSFLTKLLSRSPSLALDLVNDRKATLSDFTEFDSSSGKILPLLYQSGYITIKEYDREYDCYLLGFPNQEVEKGFLNSLLPEFVSLHGDSMGMEVANLQKAIMSNDLDKLMTIISSLVSDIPTMIQKNMYENYYLSIMHMVFRLVGFSVISELQSIYGRSDLTLANASTVYLIELKMDRGRTLEQCFHDGALQIDAKGYDVRYHACGKRIRKVVIVFSSEGKGVAGYREV